MANITKRGDTYRIKVSCGYDIQGKQIVYSKTWKPATSMTEKQAQKELQRQALDFEDKCKNGMMSNNPNITLAEFISQYLTIKEDILSPSTFERYENICEKLISPKLGHLKLTAIKPIHIQNFIKEISNEKGRTGKLPKASTVRRYLTVVQSILNQATKLEIISTNPARAEKLTLPKVVVPKIEIFTKQEASQMLACLEREELQYQVLIQLAIMTGARRGELVGLKFSDIDYSQHKITIERSAVKVTGQPITTKPPKDYEVRTIAVNDYCIELIKMLHSEKDKIKEQIGSQWIGGEWLFTQWNGEIMNPQTPTKWFSKFLKRNELRHHKFHSLRHTSATLLLYGGVNIRQVQGRLGHGDIGTTNKYLHYLSEADEQAVNVLQDMLITTKTNRNKQVV